MSFLLSIFFTRDIIDLIVEELVANHDVPIEEEHDVPNATYANIPLRRSLRVRRLAISDDI